MELASESRLRIFRRFQAGRRVICRTLDRDGLAVQFKFDVITLLFTDTDLVAGLPLSAQNQMPGLAPIR